MPRPAFPSCFICSRIDLIRKGENPYFVAETETGYVVIGDHQFFRGYTLFLSKIHVRELYELPSAMRKKFLWEMSEVAEAVIRAFHPAKLNYELLGNTEEHLHWHLVPRHSDDPNIKGPAWNIPREVRSGDSVRPSGGVREGLKEELLRALLNVSKIVRTSYRS